MKMLNQLTSAFGKQAKPEAPPPSKRKKRPAPLSIRLSEDERAALNQAAAGQSVNSYIREKLFEGPQPKRRQRSHPVKDYEALARALSLLGRSDIQTRLSALLLALETQRLEATPDIERDVRQTCATVRDIRSSLITALGLKG